MLRAKLLPAGQPPLLLGLRGEERRGALQTGAGTGGCLPFKLRASPLAALQRLVPRAALAGHIDRRQAVATQHRAERLEVGTLLARHVVDVLQISIESRMAAQESEDHRQQADRHEDPRAVVERQARQGLEQRMFTGRLRPASVGQMRQKDQHEEDRPDEHEGGKEPQIAQGRSRHRHQAQKGSDGRQIADDQRRDHLAQNRAHLLLVVQVRKQMQRVVHRNADDDRGNAQNDHRDLVAEERQAPHRKEPAEEDRHADEQQRPQRSQRVDEQPQNQHHGNGDGPQTVVFDLPGIRHGDDRSPRQVDLHLGHHPAGG